MKIGILLPDLAGGGAEKLHLNLAHAWTQKGHNVQIVLMTRRGELLDRLNPSVQLVDLNCERIRGVFKKFRRYLIDNKPDVTLVPMWPLTSVAILAWLSSRAPGRLFVSDHTHLTTSCVKELRIAPRLAGFLIKLTYPLATGVISVSEGVKNDLVRLSGIRRTRITVIYNPCASGNSFDPLSEAEASSMWGGCSLRILNVASMKEQKDQATLIRAFSRLPSFATLAIVGDGPLRPKLESLVLELGLSDRVIMPGFVQDVSRWYRTAHLFVLSSLWEGFGNVIVEAMEHGVPVISTDCDSGPAEILESGKLGVLVPPGDVEALSRAMTSSMHQSVDTGALKDRAKDFDILSVAERYLKLFETAKAEIGGFREDATC